MIKVLSALIAFQIRIREANRSIMLRTYATFEPVDSLSIAFRSGVLLFLSMSIGCTEEQAPAAPMGNKAVLEHLARSFENVGQTLPTSPMTLTPKGKRSFVIDVFERAGYSYQATLTVAAEMEVYGQNEKDLVELLLFPLDGVAIDEINLIFSADEIDAVRKLAVR